MSPPDSSGPEVGAVGTRGPLARRSQWRRNDAPGGHFAATVALPPPTIVRTSACGSQSLRRFAVPDTTCHMSISLDGFVAGPDQSREDPLGKRGRELHGWHIGDPRANDADKIANEWLMRPRGAY